MKKLTVFLALTLSCVAAFGQQFTFRVDKSAIKGFGDPLSLTAMDFTAWAAVYTEGDGVTGVTALGLRDALAPLVLAPGVIDAAILGLIPSLAANPAFLNGWVQLPPATGPVATNFDLSLIQSGLPVGASPLLLVTTAANPLAIGEGDWLGIVGSTQLVEPLTTKIMSFGATAFRYDIAILGQLGSLELYQVVPEPAHFAALVGLLGLGFVMWRRRR